MAVFIHSAAFAKRSKTVGDPPQNAVPGEVKPQNEKSEENRCISDNFPRFFHTLKQQNPVEEADFRRGNGAENDPKTSKNTAKSG